MHQFNENDVVKGSWWEYVNVGDKIQGTYVGKGSKPSKYNPGEEQQIYELMTDDGQIWYVGGKQSIDLQMKHIDFGQIIELKFIEVLDTGKGNPFKNVKVYQDKNVINKEWLMQNESNSSVEEATAESVAANTTASEETAPQFGEQNEAESNIDTRLGQIYLAGMAKSLFPDGATEADKDKIIMKTTGLGLIEENYDAILEKILQ